MSIFMQIKLNEDLKRFGLNPGEWTFRPLEGNQFQIQHRADSNFNLMGVLAADRLTWLEIQLLTL